MRMNHPLRSPSHRPRTAAYKDRKGQEGKPGGLIFSPTVFFLSLFYLLAFYSPRCTFLYISYLMWASTLQHRILNFLL